MIPALNHLRSRHHAIIAYSNTSKFKESPILKRSNYTPYDTINPSELGNMIKYANAVDLYPFCHRNRIRRSLDRGRIQWSWHPVKNSIMLYRDDLEQLNYEQLIYFTQRLPESALNALQLTQRAVDRVTAYREMLTFPALPNDWRQDNVDSLLCTNRQFNKGVVLTKDENRLLIQFKTGLKYWLKN